MSEEDSKHDPDPNRIMAKIMDDIDARLFKHGFQFKEEALLEDAVEELRAMIFKYYDDMTGGDSSYDPEKDKTPESEYESDSGESESASLHSSDEEDEMSDRETSESEAAPPKSKKAKK